MVKPSQIPQVARAQSARLVTSILTTGAVAFAVWVVASTIYIVCAGFIKLPLADDWDRWRSLVDLGYSLNWFYAIHVDHRLFVPRLLFAFDQIAFHGNGWFILVCTFCIQAITGVLLWRLAGRIGPRDRTEQILQAAAIATGLYSAQQWMNLLNPFQVQFPLVYCASVAAFFALWKCSVENWRTTWFAATILFGAVAVYSMANGNLLWPFLLVAAVWLRAPMSRLLILGGAWIVVSGSFFYHWHGSSVVQMSMGERLPRAAVFWIGHLGSPVFPLLTLTPDEPRRVAISAVIGGLLAIALLVAFIDLWRRRGDYPVARAMLFFFCGFLALTSASMAYGRVSSNIAEMIFTTRYFTPSYLFWIGMLLAWWPLLRRYPPHFLAGAICVAILAGAAIDQRAVLRDVRGMLPTKHLAELAVVDDVTDPQAWYYIFHSAELALPAVDYLRAHNMATFSDDWSHWPGSALNSHFAIDRASHACEGKFEQAEAIVTPLRPGWRVTGWAWNPQTAHPPQFVILADAGGKIAGVARSGFPQPSDLAKFYEGAGWTGYVNGDLRPITAYVLEGDGHSVCPIGTLNLNKPAVEVPFTKLGVSFPVTEPKISGAMVPDGFWKGNGTPGKPPVDGPVYGSFPDAVTASMRIGPFHIDGHGQMGIPIVTGPVSRGLAILIRDAATGHLITSLTPPPVREKWWAWRPELPAGQEMNVEIEVRDDGSGWGQWLAVGWPHMVVE